MPARAASGDRSRRSPRHALTWILPIILVAACGPSAASSAPAGTSPPPSTDAPESSGTILPSVPVSAAPASGTITLYTSVQQPVVDAVLAAFATVQPGVTVELFRAPTGELSARIAAELREGQVQGDLLWLSDPLSIQAWAQQDVLEPWIPANAEALDPADQAEAFWGTRRLNVVIVRGTDVSPAPADWDDLADPSLVDAVALPDPGFAGSAFGALGYFALNPDYGMAWYERLKANGAVQVRTPDEVTTGVAEGRFKAGITLDSSVRAAADKGSPVAMVWPASGAVSMYGPIGVVSGSGNPDAAHAFVEFLLSADGQRALGDAGQEPMLAGSGGPEPGGMQVRPDWPQVFGQQDELLEQYRAIFGG